MRQAPFLQSLTQRLTCCRRWYKKLRRNCSFKAFEELYIGQPHLNSVAKLVGANLRFYELQLRQLSRQTPVIFVIALVSLTCVVGHSWYNQPQIKVGSVAQVTVRAQDTKVIEDKLTTQEQRHLATSNLVPVLMVDESVNRSVKQKIESALVQATQIREEAGSFPYFDTVVLSISTQCYLRSASSNDWEAFRFAIESAPLQKSQPIQADYSQMSSSSAFVQALAEVETYRLTASEQNISTLTERISQARQKYNQAKAKISEIITQPHAQIYSDLIDLADDDWTKTQTLVEQIAGRILAQGIPPGLPPSVLQNAVRLNIQSSSVPKEAEAFTTKLLLRVLQTNLKIDEAKTRAKASVAAADIKPIMVEVKQDSIIVRQGEKITDWHFLVLESYGLIDREINWHALLLLATGIAGAILVFITVNKRVKYLKRTRDSILVLLLTLSTPLVLTMGTPYTTWSTVSLLLGSFYGTRISLTVIGLLLVFLPLNFEVSKIALFSGAAGAFLGSCMAHKRRSREELALLGIAIAVTQGSVFLVLKTLFEGAFVGNWYSIFKESLIFACSGLCWSVVALGLSSYLEQLFDLVTPIRLAELANPNRPLLKSLAAKTPGTFQHTLFVASLAEAAACKLGCNVELVRAGTLYHDIGKMHDPKAFIENQMGGPNKHDTEINDPWLSAEIIKKHVSEGLVIARKHRLPTAIQAFIPEHQGTMQIAYFYHQAQQIAKSDPQVKIDEADFCYDGPIPQSRETAIVMLADSCEAALRSLKEATYEQALAVVNNILRGRWQDDQLLNSGLTRAEMTQIAEIFVEVWQQFHHKRIAYPKLKSCT
jgi:cyclic-di-AMP phosphodiesterase PgpH